MAAGAVLEEVKEKGVVLLGLWASMFGLRVRIALAEKGVAYEYREEDLADKSSLLLAANPVHRKIPVLIHDGRPVCESLIILHYIDEVWPDRSPLLPSEPYARTQARFWADYIDKKMYDASVKLWKTEGESHEEGKKEFVEVVRVLEGELGERPYFNGETFGFVDIALVGYSCWFYTYETVADLSLEVECPKLVAWVKRCRQRDSVSKSLPDPLKVYSAVLVLRKRYGIE